MAFSDTSYLLDIEELLKDDSIFIQPEKIDEEVPHILDKWIKENSVFSSHSANKNFTLGDFQRLDSSRECNNDIGIVVGLTKSEAESDPMLTNEQSEESFEQLFEEIGNRPLNVNEVKMNETLESIKRRLEYFREKDNPERDNGSARHARHSLEYTILSKGQPNKTSVRSRSMYSKQGFNTPLMSGDFKPSFSNSESNIDVNLKTTMTIRSSYAGSTERSLSRASRLSNDIKMQSIQTHSGLRSESGNVENFNRNSSNNNNNKNIISPERRNQLFTEIKSKFIEQKIISAGRPSAIVGNMDRSYKPSVADAMDVLKEGYPSNAAPQTKLVNKLSTLRKWKPASSVLNKTFPPPTQRLPMQIAYEGNVKSSGGNSKVSSIDFEKSALHFNDSFETQGSHIKNTFQGSSTSKLLQMQTKNSGSYGNIIEMNNDNPGTRKLGIQKNNSGELLADKEKVPVTQERGLGERQLTQTITATITAPRRRSKLPRLTALVKRNQ